MTKMRWYWVFQMVLCLAGIIAGVVYNSIFLLVFDSVCLLVGVWEFILCFVRDI